MLERIHVRTTARDDFVDVTDQVRRVVTKSGVAEGLCHVLVPHTTAAITVNERADPNVPADIIRFLDQTIPWRRDWTHIEPNAASHVKAVLVGNATTLVIGGGQLVLGTWQAIFFCEFDGPREREFLVKVVAG